MPPASSSFTPLNVANDAVPEWMGSFTLVARPNTDLWRKPPSRDTSTAPILYTALRNPFVAAEVTVLADWELEWDQGGLVIFAGAPPGHIATSELDPPNVANISLDDTSTTTSPLSSQGLSVPNLSVPPAQIASTQPTSDASHRQDRGPPPAYVPPPTPASKWVKVGLEFCNNACHATSVVANSEGADWSLSALSPNQSRRFDLRVKIERIGYALWLWYEDEQLGWRKLREVTWFFWGVEDKAVRVGVYASRPANFAVGSLWANAGANNTGSGEDGDDGGGIGARNLCVGFEGLEIF